MGLFGIMVLLYVDLLLHTHNDEVEGDLDMYYVILGALSFLLMFGFDVYTLKNNGFMKALLGLTGLGLFIYATVMVVILPSEGVGLPQWLQVTSLMLCILFTLLLIYSLFLELPFMNTYGKEEHNNKLMTAGTYGLCRHPGVLWFGFAFLFLFLATESWLVFGAFIVWTLMDIVYILLQEKYIFVVMFPDYKEYQHQTPLLIPTKASLKKVLKK